MNEPISHLRFWFWIICLEKLWKIHLNSLQKLLYIRDLMINQDDYVVFLLKLILLMDGLVKHYSDFRFLYKYVYKKNNILFHLEKILLKFNFKFNWMQNTFPPYLRFFFAFADKFNYSSHYETFLWWIVRWCWLDDSHSRYLFCISLRQGDYLFQGLQEDFVNFLK